MSGIRFTWGRPGSSVPAPLAASLRTLGYAHFALLQPVPLAEIGRLRRSAELAGASPEPAAVPDSANAVPDPADTAENVDPTVVAGAAGTSDRSAVESPADGAAERAAPPADPVAAPSPRCSGSRG